MLLLTQASRDRIIKSIRGRLLVLALIIFLIISFSPVQAAPFISGESYTISGPVAPEGQTYSYSWSVSDGSPLSSTDSSFLWTAPVVTEPFDVVIGLIVSNGAKGCTNESQLSIQVIPRKSGEISL